MDKSVDSKKKFPQISIPKHDFNKKDEFEEKYEDIEKLGEVQYFFSIFHIEKRDNMAMF